MIQWNLTSYTHIATHPTPAQVHRESASARGRLTGSPGPPLRRAPLRSASPKPSAGAGGGGAAGSCCELAATNWRRSARCFFSAMGFPSTASCARAQSNAHANACAHASQSRAFAACPPMRGDSTRRHLCSWSPHQSAGRQDGKKVASPANGRP